MTNIHPALGYSFEDLHAALMERVNSGSINMVRSGTLALFNYSTDCQFANQWDTFTMMARGLILDTTYNNKSIVALPFVKFFNASEQEGASVVKFDAPFDAYTKMDGSLGIVYFHDGSWHVATRGSLTSAQSRWAEQWLHNHIKPYHQLDPNVTYLCEIIYDENRIVINYPFEGLVMLGAYNRVTGIELDYDDLVALCARIGMRIATRHSFGSFADAQEFVKTLPGNEEGFVIRFRESGERVKLKGSEYCALHKIISNITPLAIWELLCSGYSIDDYKKVLPEEFWEEVDEIVEHFQKRAGTIMLDIVNLYSKVSGMTDRELGMLIQNDWCAVACAGYLFPYRKKGASEVYKQVLKNLRPTGNVIEGYTPSDALQRSQSEE